MKIIPVIDLKDGLVVHAKQGQREHYQPLISKLCPSSDIYQVMNAFLSLYPFDTFYIADLNALMQQGHHDSLLIQLLDHFPAITFWVDQGRIDYQQPLRQNNYVPVLASEAYTNEYLEGILDFQGRFILSLDFSGERFLGSNQLLQTPANWPDNIIIMSLAHVGSQTGPDLSKLTTFKQQYPNKQFIAAGGIRNSHDLATLAQAGITQALVASALHDGTIGTQELMELEGKKIPR